VSKSWALNPGRRRNMQANRSRDTKPELRIRSLLHARGLRFRVNRRPLPEVRLTADIVFTRARVAVFVDGCWWHKCPEHYKPPGRNADYWLPKVERNVRRDLEIDQLLREAGWTVIRAWEHQDPAEVADWAESAVRGGKLP
jgi:DNA mismatch endonuclease (patch repair protein)